MKLFFDWLASLFRVEVVWIDKGQGRWIRRRRYHPLTRAVVVVGVLALGLSWGLDFFYAGDKAQRDETAELGEAEERIDLHARTRELDFPFVSEDVASYDAHPGPIPAEFAVDGGEYWLRIDKSRYSLYLYRGRDVDRIYKIAVGKNPGDKKRQGDNKTPNGIFSVQSIENSSTWNHDFGDGKGVVRGAYGPWFIRLRTGWRGIGIHGTHAPDSIGTMVSEGCIRMQNAELEELKKLAFRDMKVVIEE